MLSELESVKLSIEKLKIEIRSLQALGCMTSKEFEKLNQLILREEFLQKNNL